MVEVTGSSPVSPMHEARRCGLFVCWGVSEMSRMRVLQTPVQPRRFAYRNRSRPTGRQTIARVGNLRKRKGIASSVGCSRRNLVRPDRNARVRNLVTAEFAAEMRDGSIITCCPVPKRIVDAGGRSAGGRVAGAGGRAGRRGNLLAVTDRGCACVRRGLRPWLQAQPALGERRLAQHGAQIRGVPSPGVPRVTAPGARPDLRAPRGDPPVDPAHRLAPAVPRAARPSCESGGSA